MNALEVCKKKWRPIVIGTAVLVTAAVLLIVLKPFSASAAGNTQEVYKETKVAYGDITVGVTESGTASLETQSITYGTAATVEELYVKAGQTVSEGDPVVKLSLDDVSDEMERLQLEYSKAQVEYNQALLDQKLKTVEAGYTYESNLDLSETAQTTYETTLGELADEVSKAKDKKNGLKDQVEEYEELVDGGLYSQYKIAALKASISEKEHTVVQLKELKEHLGGCPGCDGYDHSATAEEVTEKLDEAQTALDELNLSFGEVWKQYSNALLEAENKLDSLKDDYSSALSSYHKAINSRDLNELLAQAQLDEELTTSDNAKLIYEIELAQLSNAVANTQLQLESIQLEMEELDEYMTDGVLTAPCTGLVMSVGYRAGDEVAANMPIATIADNTGAYVEVSIAQDDIADISIDGVVSINFDAYPEENYTGVVDSITTSPARGGASTVSYTVSVKVEDDASRLYEGMTGDVTFITKQVKNVLYVSNKAVSNMDGKQYVKVRDEAGNITQTLVETGFSDGRNVEIISGLQEGDIALIESQVAQR